MIGIFFYDQRNNLFEQQIQNIQTVLKPEYFLNLEQILGMQKITIFLFFSPQVTLM